MQTATKSKPNSKTATNNSQGQFFGRLFSFNTSLKLYHWHVTGKGSYAQHMAIDLALESLSEVLDRIVETSISKYGEQKITVPEANAPQDIVGHCESFYGEVEKARDMFSEDFTDSIIDDWQEAVQQLLYRLKRLQ